MAFFKVCAYVVLLVVVVGASPTGSFWKNTPFASSVEEMRSSCEADDTIACLKLKALTFLDSILSKDNFQLTENVEVSRNSYRSIEGSARNDASMEDHVEEYIKSHDVTLKVPVAGTTITLDSQRLDKGEIDLKLNFEDSGEVQARKSKLKKIVIPILVFVLLKAMTLVPLALGILGLKAWNALQLSFFSFVVAIGLAVFQLCKKIASDHTAPQIAAHPPWEPAYASNYIARAFNDAAHELAYSAYLQK